MQRRACGLCLTRSTRRSGRDRPRRGEPDLMSLDTTAKPPAPAPIDGLPRNSGAGRSRRSLPRWRWPRWIRRSPTSRCPPLPPTSMSARPTWSGWSTSIRSRWLRRCCRSARSAKSSVIGGSISAACCCSRWPRSVCAFAWSLPSLTAGAGAAGIGRQRHHERERGAGPLRLPDPYARPRLRPQRAGGRNGVHARPDDCLRRSLRSEHGRGCSRSISRSA